MTAAVSKLRAAVAAAKDAGLLSLPRPQPKPGTPMKREVEPFIDADELKAANDRHDREHGDPLAWSRSRVRSSWCKGRAWR